MLNLVLSLLVSAQPGPMPANDPSAPAIPNAPALAGSAPEVAAPTDDNDNEAALLRSAASGAGAGLGAVGGFAAGWVLATVYLTVRGSQISGAEAGGLAEALGVAIGVPLLLSATGSAVGAGFAPLVIAQPPSGVAAGTAAGGAVLGSAVGAIPGAIATVSSAGELVDAIQNPDCTAGLLSVICLSGGITLFFAGLGIGAVCGGTAGGAAAGLIDPVAPKKEIPPIERKPEGVSSGAHR